MLNFLVAIALLVPSSFELWFFLPSFPLLPAMLALLYRASSISLAPDLALKTSVLTFVSSDYYTFTVFVVKKKMANWAK